MIRIGRAVEVRLMAGEAICRSSGVCCRMAAVAGRARVAIGQWKSRGMDVSGKLPRWRCLAMTRFAILRESGHRMIGFYRGRVVVTMAPGALRRRPGKLARQLIDMASAAVGDRMRPDKRKPTLRVLLKLFTVAGPVLRRMASLALCPELSPVDIGMAIRAGRLRLDKPEIGMAGRAPGL